MDSILKAVAVVSCSFLLCLGLSSVTRASNSDPTEDEMKAEQTDRRQGGQEAGEKQISDKMREGHSQGVKTIEGKVLRIEGDNWFLKQANGKEIKLHIDQTTQQSPKEIDGQNMKGVLVEANVDDQNHALTIRSSDRRTDHSSETNAEAPAR